ncbi:Hsp33 family molecular chaperone HslO [Thalassotalea sp. LPB0316]|uniref:Hsp33 family molecular chaperone HslO n=1 Tax=Thalassotalea sp. LPB0316 TaxID=2769490 RepID=UPI0018673628|nr:Hsp33 family molecular chaperone HslO [Thalassotalea sp. LPB0316]QOL26585.1 Hsp33 family molecular chaperone HslO [Thalassotalea sp. LPB0316]
MSTQDVLHRYLFDNMHARGELVQLEKTYQDIIADHNYPAGVKALLGEMLSATCLLTATLKFEGEITVQLQGDGPVSYLAINGDDQQNMRGVAKLAQTTQATGLKALIGKGTMVITIRPKAGEPYQGIVALEKDTLADCLANYFETSDQIPTSVWLFTDIEQGKAAGALVQLLPDSEDKEQQLADYNHLCQLTQTIKQDEIFSLEAHELLYRLYHQEEVRIFEPQTVKFRCSCSEEKVLTAISQLGQEEIADILAEQGEITTNCDFCLTTYRFDQSHFAQYFSDKKH